MLYLKFRHVIFPDQETMPMAPEEIGEIIRKTRKAQGLRQPELAAASGVGLRFLVELERGKATVQLGKVLAVLAALGCSVSISTPEDQI